LLRWSLFRELLQCLQVKAKLLQELVGCLLAAHCHSCTPAYNNRSFGGVRIVVFVGCGMIGRQVIEGTIAKLPNADFTLIDTRSYFENNIGTLIHPCAKLTYRACLM
jgi:hypothetical protein